MNLLNKLAISTILLIGTNSVYAGVQEELSQLQKRWAEVNYTMKGEQQEAGFEALVSDAEKAVSTNTNSAELLIWDGVIKASFAGAKGGLGAMSLAKAAKADFEKALTMDERALHGSSYTNLGVLYFKVPGWPIGFGDDDKAKAFFEKALAIDSEGIENNYFYADYLLDQGQYAEAETYLLKAQNAAPRPNRPLADKERRAEITVALEKVRSKLTNKNKNTNASITDRR